MAEQQRKSRLVCLNPLETYEDLLNELSRFSKEELKKNISIKTGDDYISGASGLIASQKSDGDVLEAGHPFIQAGEIWR